MDALRLPHFLQSIGRPGWLPNGVGRGTGVVRTFWVRLDRPFFFPMSVLSLRRCLGTLPIFQTTTCCAVYRAPVSFGSEIPIFIVHPLFLVLGRSSGPFRSALVCHTHHAPHWGGDQFQSPKKTAEWPHSARASGFCSFLSLYIQLVIDRERVAMRRTTRDREALLPDTAAPVVLSAGVVALLVCSGTTQTAPGASALIVSCCPCHTMPTPQTNAPEKSPQANVPCIHALLPIRYRRAHPQFAPEQPASREPMPRLGALFLLCVTPKKT